MASTARALKTPANAETVAPPAYQAEVLRGQLCDDINRRFWRARRRLIQAFEGRKERIERDYSKLSPAEFLAMYDDWRFL
jgi:hypothetical protein